MTKRIFYFFVSLSLILALSFSSSALIVRQNGLCYSNLPEPQQSNLNVLNAKVRQAD